MIIAALFFIILGVLVKYGKMYFLIAGYNTLPKSEKEKYDIEGIASVFRNGMFAIGLIIIAGHFISKNLEIQKFENYAFWGALIVGISYILIHSNLKRFKKDGNS